MTKETLEVVKALSEVMGIDFTNEEDVENNACCGVGSLHTTVAECQRACDKWNKLADLMGFPKLKVFKWVNINDKTFYVCSHKQEAEEEGYFEVA